MKKLIWLPLLVVMMSTTSCATWNKIVGPAEPEEVGKTVTVAYLLSKEKLKPEHRKAIQTTYKVFDSLLSENPENPLDIPKILKEAVRKEVKDDAVTAAAGIFIDKIWARINEEYDLKTYEDKKGILKILRKFHAGVKVALIEYDYLR